MVHKPYVHLRTIGNIKAVMKSSNNISAVDNIINRSTLDSTVRSLHKEKKLITYHLMSLATKCDHNNTVLKEVVVSLRIIVTSIYIFNSNTTPRLAII